MTIYIYIEDEQEPKASPLSSLMHRLTAANHPRPASDPSLIPSVQGDLFKSL